MTPRGYALVKLIRKYVECNMFASFEVHTESTLHDFEVAISQFGTLLKVRALIAVLIITLSYFIEQEYEAYTVEDEPRKDWNFVKAHLQLHAILDIRQKGKLSSMTTKQSEKFHGPMRKNYLQRTNFKKVISQVRDYQTDSLNYKL